MVEQSPAIENLGKALSLAQSQMLGAKKDSINPHFRSRYADLESVWEGCRDALTSNGLSVVQMPGFEDGMCVLYTQLIHSSGEWIRSRSAAPILKQEPQAVGSALTYLRRYALAAVVGVCPEDDDGNASSGRHPETERKKAPTKQSTEDFVSQKSTPSFNAREQEPPPLEDEHYYDALDHEKAPLPKSKPSAKDPALAILDTPAAKPKRNRWECHPRLLAACKERAAELGNGDREKTTKAGSRLGDAIEREYGPLPEIPEGDKLEGAIEMAVEFER